MSYTTTIEHVDLAKIVVDRLVQRTEGINQRHLDKIVATFNPDAMGVLVLSRREDGTYVVLDGMHRHAAAVTVGWRGDVWAKVFYGLTVPEEAGLFLLYNDRKDPSAISRFNARVISEEPVACAVNEIVHGHGWTVRQSDQKGSIAAVETLERVYRTASGTRPDGVHPVVLNRVLATITGAWGYEIAGASSAILGGLGQLYGRFKDAVETEKLVAEMQKMPPRELVGKATTLRSLQGGTIAPAMAKTLVGLHNKSRRSNLLPEWNYVR